MQTTIYNERQLETVLNDIYDEFYRVKQLNICYGKASKSRTLKQLGFFFGGICRTIQEHFIEQGINMETDEIKEILYSSCAEADERLKTRLPNITGRSFVVPKRLSNMTTQEASLLIDLSIKLVDNSVVFDGVVLHPSLRYCWIHNLTKEDFDFAKTVKYNRYDPEYLQHIRNEACLWCGQHNRTQAHHLKIAGESGVAYKSDDVFVVPLCDKCHKLLHDRGVKAFLDDCSWITKYVDFQTFCVMNYSRWRAKL